MLWVFKLMDALNKVFHWQEQEHIDMDTPAPTLPTAAERLYQTAKASLGHHLTLDTSVAAELGCAEAVSAVLAKAGIPVPNKGFQGTWALYKWLLGSPDFKAIDIPTPGCVVISPTGTAKAPIFPHGHTGIVLQHGIGSNDSANGRFQENYTVDGWTNHFTKVGGYPTYYFLPL